MTSWVHSDEPLVPDPHLSALAGQPVYPAFEYLSTPEGSVELIHPAGELALDLIKERAMIDTAAKIGQVVRYHTGSLDTAGEGVDGFYVAAIVTMTPQEWQPGYRTTDGEWVPVTDISQPKAGTVHLHLFQPTMTKPTAWTTELSDVPHGTAHGCWSEIS